MSEECGGCALMSDRRGFIRQVLGLIPLSLVPMRVTSEHKTIEYAIPPLEGPFIDSANDVIVMRWRNVLYAFSLACPHQNTALRWKAGAGRFQCPKHNSKYEPDGAFISGRATRAMDRFALHRKGDLVVVDVTKLHARDKDPAGWAAAALRL